MDSDTSIDPLAEPLTAGKSSKDPVIEEMEKFMKETEIVEADALTVSNGKIYNTENLLHILGSRNTPENACVGCVPSPEKPKMRVLPKRRKTQEKCEEPSPKKVKTSKATKKSLPRLKHAQEHIVRCETCEKMASPKKRRATRLHYCKSHRGKIGAVEIRNDEKVTRNDSKSGAVKVKREVEVIDLTQQDGDSCYMLVSFGEQRQAEVICFGSCEGVAPLQYQRATAATIAGEEASATVPDVRDDLSLSVIDLTLDEEKAPRVTISEKECANAILPLIHQFHEMSQVFQEADNTFEDCSFSENSKVMGYHLVQALSDMFVKNINMSRFLEILVSKMEEKYKLLLATTTVAYYLKMMFQQNRHYCKNKLTQNLLKEIDNYYTAIKSENGMFAQDFPGTVEPAIEVFTQDQLRQLAVQIRQYHELFEDAVTIFIAEEDTADCVFSCTVEKVETN